ncbi:hypothetical protein FACS1894186_4950 [Alphaproteobacteria bacterium]|nr:hypothetical protein FACS1894186_4950 [Alphaproteobacteria bacterium]
MANNDKVHSIASAVLTLYFMLADVHYLALKKRRWDIHKLADKIRKDLITGWLDDMQEVHAIPVGGAWYGGKDLLSSAAKLSLDKPADLNSGLDACAELMVVILGLIDKVDKPKGTDNLLSGFAQELQQYLGWIGETSKEETKKNEQR